MQITNKCFQLSGGGGGERDRLVMTSYLHSEALRLNRNHYATQKSRTGSEEVTSSTKWLCDSGGDNTSLSWPSDAYRAFESTVLPLNFSKSCPLIHKLTELDQNSKVSGSVVFTLSEDSQTCSQGLRMPGLEPWKLNTHQAPQRTEMCR